MSYEHDPRPALIAPVTAVLALACVVISLACGGSRGSPGEPAGPALTPVLTATPRPTQTVQPARGDGPAVPVVSIRSQFVWPAGGSISTYFGAGHPNGIDIALSHNEDSPIRASAAGIVTFAGSDCCVYGKHVIVSHDGDLRTLYAHLDRIDIADGELVQQGQVIGLGGSTGDATGKHLHFSIYQNDVAQDPLRYLANAIVHTGAACTEPIAIGPASTVMLTIPSGRGHETGQILTGEDDPAVGPLETIADNEVQFSVAPAARAGGQTRTISVTLGEGNPAGNAQCRFLVSVAKTYPNPPAPRPRHNVAPSTPAPPTNTPTATPQLRLIQPTATPTRIPPPPTTPVKPTATKAPPLTFPLRP